MTKCDFCGGEIDFTEARAHAPGDAELLNRFGGTVARIVSTRDESRIICVVCVTEQEAEAAQRAAGLVT